MRRAYPKPTEGYQAAAAAHLVDEKSQLCSIHLGKRCEQYIIEVSS